MLETYLKMLDVDYYEAKFAFEGLANENVWKRPAPGLLSVGEIAGHIAHWEAVRLAGEGEDLSKCKVKSPLIDSRFRYHTSNLETVPSDEQLAMTAEQVWNELARVHEESVAHFRSLNPDSASPVPGMGGWTYGAQLEYMVFHVAYHVGQMYSARHLLGEQTPDN